MKKYLIVILLSLFVGCDNQSLGFWQDYGNECPCSNLWDEGKTPKYVTVVFSGMVDCNAPGTPPIPNGRPFVLEQQQLQAYKWALYNAPEFDFTVEWYPTRGEIVLATMLGHMFFHQVGPIPPVGECVAFFDDSICYCSEPSFPFQSEGGTAQVSWHTDLNGDGIVNFADYVPFSNTWGLVEGDSGYDASCDFAQDGCVNGKDLLIFADNWLNRF